MTRHNLPERRSSSKQISDFLRTAATTPMTVNKSSQGRLIFALDATASRQPTWDRACQLQSEMFKETAALGGLTTQLVWYRGIGEFAATPWVNESKQLIKRMSAVSCRGGLTQIARVLNHAIKETQRHRVNALVFVGDCMEEDAGQLCRHAGQLGLLGVPLLLFQEGNDPTAAGTFQEMARLSHGAYCTFDSGSAEQLRELLRAAAVYAAGGAQALTALSRAKGGLTRQLTYQLKG